jgi:hypothetical protein
VSEINQCIHTTVGFQVNAAAITTIATIRATEWNIFFTPETDNTITTITGTNFYRCFINEFHMFTDIQGSPD